MKIISILGTRPEAIKMAPVIKELKSHKGVDSRVCVTAQHRMLLDQVLEVFGITPDWDLNIMTEGQDLARLTASALTSIDPLLVAEKPDWVLVQGDTTTAMAASMAAFYRGIKIGHVEAGLRTSDKNQPFPEEINRRITGLMAELHFAPTSWAQQNLIREGVAPDKISKTGNPVIDALFMAIELAKESEIRAPVDIPMGRRILLVTAHRRENFGGPLHSICMALKELAQRYRERIHIVYPVHLNPQVYHTVHQLLAGEPGITLAPPLDYLSMVELLQRCYIVLTDSGGLQEEAPALGKPVLIMRSKTERHEGVEAGTARLAGTDQATIVSEVSRLLDDSAFYSTMAQSINPYGDGRAASRIVHCLLRSW